MKKEYDFPDDLCENEAKGKIEEIDQVTEGGEELVKSTKSKNKMIAMAIGVCGVLALGGAWSNKETESKLAVQAGEYIGIEVLESETMETDVWLSFLETVSVEAISKDVVEELKTNIYDRIAITAENYSLTLATYIASMGKDAESFEEYIQLSAEQQYLELVAVEYVANAEGLTPTVEEYESLILDYIHQLGYIDIEKAEANGYTQAELERIVLSRIVKNWLVSHATIVDELSGVYIDEDTSDESGEEETKVESDDSLVEEDEDKVLEDEE